jgi:predicted restriction endonuclease
MSITWQQAVKSALERYAARNATVKIERNKFLAQEFTKIILDTKSTGTTPAQTVSRVLQELRDEGFLFFSNTGLYTLNKVLIKTETEDLPDDVIENAIVNGKLILSDVKTSSDITTARIRRGMSALRIKTLYNYKNNCALCDINDDGLLVASHIDRWADNHDARGILTNTICFCTFHDKLFENGYFSMNDNLELI